MSHQHSVGSVGHAANQFKVANWRLYQAELCRRGTVTLCVTEQAWRARPRKTPGGQEHYSPSVIEMMLLLRRVLHLTLRETENLMSSIMGFLNVDLPVPDHTTMSRRGASIASHHVQFPDGPLHIRLDDHGLNVFGRNDLPSGVPPGCDDCLGHLHIDVDPRTEALVVSRRDTVEALDAFLTNGYSGPEAGERGHSASRGAAESQRIDIVVPLSGTAAAAAAGVAQKINFGQALHANSSDDELPNNRDNKD